jgi:hypothetical protein
MTRATYAVEAAAGRYFPACGEEDLMNRPLLSERTGLLAGSDPRS